MDEILVSLYNTASSGCIYDMYEFCECYIEAHLQAIAPAKFYTTCVSIHGGWIPFRVKGNSKVSVCGLMTLQCTLEGIVEKLAKILRREIIFRLGRRLAYRMAMGVPDGSKHLRVVIFEAKADGSIEYLSGGPMECHRHYELISQTLYHCLAFAQWH